MKSVAAAVASISQDDITKLENEGSLDITVDGNAIKIERADVEIVSEDIPGWTVANEGSLTVALDLEISEELKQEGMARELIKRIQAYRKEHGFVITDRIRIVLGNNQQLEAAVSKFKEYISSQVLADSIEFKALGDGSDVLDFDEFKEPVEIVKSVK